jgi:hypothetical protein
LIISDEVRNALLNAGAALVNGGDILFLEGATPRLTFALKPVAFAPAAAGTAALDVASPTMSAAAASSATVAVDNYQFRTSGGLVRFSGDVGALGSGAEFEMNHPDVEIGDIATITSYVLTMPAGS